MKQVLIFTSLTIAMHIVSPLIAMELSPIENSIVCPNKEIIYKVNGAVSGTKFMWTVFGGKIVGSETDIYAAESIKVIWNDEVEGTSAKYGRVDVDELDANGTYAEDGWTRSASYQIRSLNGALTFLGANLPMAPCSNASRLFQVIPLTTYLGESIEITTYEWVLPEGIVSDNGQTGTFESGSQLTVTPSSSFAQGTIKVRAKGECPNQYAKERSIDVSRLKFTTQPPSNLSSGATISNVAVSPVSCASEYQWELPSTWKANGQSGLITTTGNTLSNITVGLVSAPIKVRAKIGSAYTGWIGSNPINVNVAISGNTYLCSEPSSSISISNPTNATLEWSATGGGKLALSLNAANSGVTITRTTFDSFSEQLVLKVDGTPVKSIEITACKITPTLSGPTKLCSSGPHTYQVSNLPAGAAVAWQSGLGLSGTANGNTYSITPFMRGSSYVKATVSLGGVSHELLLPVVVGGERNSAVIAYDSYGAVSSLCLNKSYTLKAVPEDECSTQSEWTFNGHDFPILGYSSSTNMTFSATNTVCSGLRFRDFLGWYDGSCGSISLMDCGGGISLSPNPVGGGSGGGLYGGGVNINCPTCDSRQPLDPRVLSKASVARRRTGVSAAQYEVQVRSYTGVLLLSGAVVMENGQARFDLSSLPNGIYLLTLLENGVPVGSQQVAVQY